MHLQFAAALLFRPPKVGSSDKSGMHSTWKGEYLYIVQNDKTITAATQILSSKSRLSPSMSESEGNKKTRKGLKIRPAQLLAANRTSQTLALPKQVAHAPFHIQAVRNHAQTECQHHKMQ